MTFKTLLAIVTVDDAVPDTEKAIEICAELDAHLSVLVVGAAFSPTGAYYDVSTVWLEQREQDMKDVLDARSKVEELCRKNAVSFDVDHLYDEQFVLQNYICARAMYADLVITGKGIRANNDLRNLTIAAASFEAGTPVILQPDAGAASVKPKNVLLAWNSRPEAAKAAKQALPLLTAAERAHVVLVDPVDRYLRNGGEPGADAATFLSRHGAKVEVEQIASGGQAIEDVLRRHAREIGADIIVMGAYGHSRLRERVFGGVTASLLEACEIPLFIAR